MNTRQPFASRGNVWYLLLKIVATVVFVYLVNRSLNRYEIGRLIVHLSLRHWGGAFLLGCIGLYFQVKRWQIILRYQKLPAHERIVWKTILWGHFLAFITPGRAGEIMRGLPLTEDRKADSIFAVIIDKVFIIVTVFSAGILCIVLQLLFLHMEISPVVKTGIGIIVFLCGAGFFVLVTNKMFDEKHLVSRYFNRLLKGLPRLLTPAGMRAMLYSCIAHGCLIAQTVILLSMFRCGPLFQVTLAAGQAYAIMPFLPFFIGNMGVREGAYVFFLKKIGLSSVPGELSIESAALATSLSILIINLLIPACLGLLLFVIDRSTLRKKGICGTKA